MVHDQNRLINFLEDRLAKSFTHFLQRRRADLIKNIGLKRNGAGAPRALIIYVANAVPYYVTGNVFRCPVIDSHAMYWEAAEMVRIMVENGYVVDFVDCFRPIPEIEWERYSVVVDEGNHLVEAPDLPGQIRAYYCTGLHWRFHNEAELRRLLEFGTRNGLLLPASRVLAPNFSDQKSDYIFWWSHLEWMKFFHPSSNRQEITTSVTFVPNRIDRDHTKREFLWMGSHGAIHKGLDLAVEALRSLPDVNFHIFGPIDNERRFFDWLKMEMKRNPAIHFHGPAQISSAKFQSVIKNCVGHIYPSCSEGGPGSVAQTSHFGIIPIVTHTANARSGSLGFTIHRDNTNDIIAEISTHVKHLISLTDREIQQKSEELIDFTRNIHTREAYSSFFRQFVERIKTNPKPSAYV